MTPASQVAVLVPTAQPMPTRVLANLDGPEDQGTGFLDLLIRGMIGLALLAAVLLGIGAVWYLRREGA
jgi:hypothetical protein